MGLSAKSGPISRNPPGRHSTPLTLDSVADDLWVLGLLHGQAVVEPVLARSGEVLVRKVPEAIPLRGRLGVEGEDVVVAVLPVVADCEQTHGGVSLTSCGAARRVPGAST